MVSILIHCKDNLIPCLASFLTPCLASFFDTMSGISKKAGKLYIYTCNQLPNFGTGALNFVMSLFNLLIQNKKQFFDGRHFQKTITAM